jgi:hypothetical protein
MPACRRTDQQQTVPAMIPGTHAWMIFGDRSVDGGLVYFFRSGKTVIIGEFPMMVYHSLGVELVPIALISQTPCKFLTDAAIALDFL